MTTKTVIKELNLLDVEDIERALSDYYCKKVSLEDVECTLYYCIREDTCELSDSYLQFDVGDKWCDAFDLFYDNEENEFIVNGQTPSFSGTCLPPEEIFNFDVSAFKKFEYGIDGSD